jgi:hypothetical protein
MLDEYGFRRTESHLNEWNFLPGGTWGPVMRGADPAERQRFYETMSGGQGAAFIITSLIELQDEPVDVCNLFHGEIGGFGLFNEHGVPGKNYEALQAFHALVAGGARLAVSGGVPGKLAVAASCDASRCTATILVSNTGLENETVRVRLRNAPWQGAFRTELRVIAKDSSIATGGDQMLQPKNAELELRLPGSSVGLATLRWDAPE